MKSVYDEAIEMDTQEALVAIQEPLEALAGIIQDGVTKEEESDTVSPEDNGIAEIKALMQEQFGLLNSRISAIESNPQKVLPEQPADFIPERKSLAVTMNPELFAPPAENKESETPNLTATVRRSVGLDN